MPSTTYKRVFQEKENLEAPGTSVYIKSLAPFPLLTGKPDSHGGLSFNGWGFKSAKTYTHVSSMSILLRLLKMIATNYVFAQSTKNKKKHPSR